MSMIQKHGVQHAQFGLAAVAAMKRANSVLSVIIGVLQNRLWYRAPN